MVSFVILLVRWLMVDYIYQGSKNRPSPIRLDRVVTASVLTESIPTPDTSVCFELVELGINLLNSVNSVKFPR